MKKQDYRYRIIDKEVERYLNTFKAICIEGPKWCGKTSTSMVHSASATYLGDPRGNFSALNMARLDNRYALDGDIPHMIDEWQMIPQLWDGVKYAVDQRSERGQYILTGSSTPAYKGISHSGAGRIATMLMHSMSLYESGESDGSVSLNGLFNGEFNSSHVDDISLEDLIFYIIRGGWPESLSLPRKDAMLLAKSYVDSIIRDDIRRLDNRNIDLYKISLLMKSLARHESSTASRNTIIKDVEIGIDGNTVSSYIDILNRLFIIEDIPPFALNARSSLKVKQAKKHHLTDPSIPAAILGFNERTLKNDLQSMGFLFESLCLRDLLIYAGSIGGRLYHYQDYGNNEIDAIVENEDGEWCGIEIKLGTSQIDEATKNLTRIANNIAKAGKAPAFLAVISGMSNCSYRRDDGVYVFPITALKD